MSLERAQRAGLLQAAHHLTLRCDGTDAALSMIADVMHVVSSTAHPVSRQAAAAAISAVLHLLASHLRLAVDGARERALDDDAFARSVVTTADATEPLDNGGCPPHRLDSNIIARTGRLMVQTMDAAAVLLLVNEDNHNDGYGSTNARNADDDDVIYDVLCGANAALLSLVSTAVWIGSSSSIYFHGSGSDARSFDDVAHTAYQSSGRLGLALHHLEGSSDVDTALKRECTNMRLHRAALRAATAAVRGGFSGAGAHSLDNLTNNPIPSAFVVSAAAVPSNRHERRVAKLRKIHWVDTAAQEPSSDEEQDGDGDDDDDSMFCVRPSAAALVLGIAGWEMDENPDMTDQPPPP